MESNTLYRLYNKQVIETGIQKVFVVMLKCNLSIAFLRNKQIICIV